MGIVVSTTKYAPLALTSAIIGFVSFAFTVATFLRIVWVNIMTMSESSHEVHAFITDLRTELLEERANIRNMRKRYRQLTRKIRREHDDLATGMELNDLSLKTTGDNVRHLIKQFREIERPFLSAGSEGINEWKKHRARRRNSSVSPYYEHSAYASPPEKGDRSPRSRTEQDRGRRGREDDEDEEDRFWAVRTDYAPFTLTKRFIWLWKKPKAQSLQASLSRMQVRRIAMQVGGIVCVMHDYGTRACRTNDAVDRIEERMNTIVGIRRVDG